MAQIPNVLGARLFQLNREKLTALAETLCSELTARGGYFGGIRPDNIGYSDDGNVTLGRPAGTGGEDHGTEELEYMAPEVFWSGVQSPAADVYSIGLLLYAGVSNGLLPFYPADPTPVDRADALKRRMNGDALPMPRAAGKELAEIIRKATTFRASDRYESPAELRDALVQYRADLRASVPTAKEMFDKPEQELSDVERMMLGILAERAVDMGEPVEEAATVEQASSEAADIEVEVVEMPPEEQPLSPEVEEAAAAIERRQSKPAETIIVVPHPKAELPEDAPAAQPKSAPVQPQPQPKSAPVQPQPRPAAQPVRPQKTAAPARRQVPEQRSDVERQRQRKAGEVSDRVEDLGWLGKDKKKKGHGGQIAAIVVLLLAAAVLGALILNQLGYIHLGGGDTEVVIESTAPTTDVTEEPTPTPTPEPTPTPTPEPTPTPVPSSTYDVVVSNVSWEQAKLEAEARGGHLAVIDSPEELMEVAQLAGAQGVEYVWLGLYRPTGGELSWVVPTETPFYQWAPGEPSVQDAATGAPEDYVILRNVNGTWYYNDIMNDPVTNYPQFYGGRIAYIVEYQE
ncbi:MAG: protein kinase [Oscillospiraceae bacterium]|nr:protein kinase [Oscillospiraceae bacterium]